MIMTRTPLRVSLAGGGTDNLHFLEYYKAVAIVSMAINKYIYISIHPYLNKKQIKLKYSDTELVDNPQSIKHPLFRQVLSNLFPQVTGIEICVTSDIPSGTGMGSSSAFLVGLLKALCAYTNMDISDQDLFILCFEQESRVHGRSVGFQDFLAPLMGGFRSYIITDTLTFHEKDLTAKHNWFDGASQLNLFYLGGQRNAENILVSQDENWDHKLQILKSLFINALNMSTLLGVGDSDIIEVGDLVKEGWNLKKSLSPLVSNLEVDTLIEDLNKVCYGSKLLGAGGTGFVLTFGGESSFLVDLMAKKGYDHISFLVEPEGSKVVYKE